MSEAPLVLVVDDDRDIAQLVQVRLELAGHRVAVAHDGEAGLDLARRLMPAAAVLDVSMPGLSGVEITRRLSSDPATAGIVVVILSARAEDDDVERAIQAGAFCYLTKPFAGRDLIDSVAGALAHGGAA